MSDAIWYACVLELEAVDAGVIPGTHGQQVHGLFFDLLRSAAPDLATTLHGTNGRQPFTLSPLAGLPPVRGPGHLVAAGMRVSIRCTLLNADVFSGFLGSLFGDRALHAVQLGDIPFKIRRIAVTHDEHPLAGTIRPARLLEAATAATTVTMEMVTPTAFSMGTRPGLGKVIEPLPRPDLLFGSLLAAWNDASDVLIDREMRNLMAAHVVISRYQLRSARYHFRNHIQIGTVGHCTYSVKGVMEPFALRQLNALADAAFYLGVGYRTTMGMGQVRRIERSSDDAR